MPGRHEAELDELRTIVLRAREEARALTEYAVSAREALADERARLTARREELEAATLDAHRNGQLGHEERALVDRVERGETSWTAVAHGTDQHWTAEGLRARVADGVEETLDELLVSDPDFRDEYLRVQQTADETTRGPGR